QVWADSVARPLDEAERERIISAHEQLAGEGMRVLGVAFRLLDARPAEVSADALERDLTFLGQVAMIDPLRQEAKGAVATCKAAGIRPVMITGDHPQTARQIAGELGMLTNDRILTGQELERMSAQELEAVVEDVSVYARVSPEHKLKIVEALQARGEIVAMTGDGVNDAPALKKADIGVAMGLKGTDVSKEASDLVLLDDNFATIVAAVEEGRLIYDNIRKFIKYVVTGNCGKLWMMLVGPFIGIPLPLLPLQILWINFVTDGLPGLALSVEPAERDIMKRPPRHPNESLLGRGMGAHILTVGLLSGSLALGVGYAYWRSGNPAWQTMIFLIVVLAQMGQALAIRSGRDSIFHIGFLSNRPLFAVVILTAALQIAVVYVPVLQGVFRTVALPLRDLAFALVISTAIFWYVEAEKWWLRRAARS
ncbi:MAG TPA: cation-translocating P-type ATPase, partial [Blastocatellia bacterium]|nr:cation-translocating P-type ATPase [Blastocatellia bacterium]